MNIQTYARSQRAKLATVLEREKLSCWLVATVQGPLTLTWRLRAHNPDTATIKRLLGLGSVLQSALLVESVRVQLVAGLVEIAIPSPQPCTPNAGHMAAGSNGLCVAVGWNSQAEPVTVDLARHGAMAWVGPSRRGKTQAMRSTLFSVAGAVKGNLRYAIIAQQSKLHDWQAFDGSKHSLGIASEPGDIEQCVKWFASRCRIGRMDAIEFVLLIDDLPSVLAVARIGSELGTIASVGAGVGVHLWIGSQMLGANAGSGGGLVENNISARVVYRPASNATGARNSGQGGLDTSGLSTSPGDAIAVVDGHSERIATAQCNDATVATLPQGRLEKWHRIWQKTPAGSGSGNGSNMVAEQFLNGSNTGSMAVLDVSTGVQGSMDTLTGSDGSGEPFTLPSNAMPSPAQRLRLYAAWCLLGSKNETMRQVFGCKNGNVLAWLNMAISENQPDGNDSKIISMAERRIA